VNQILRTVSTSFVIRPTKHVTFYCDKFSDLQLCVATCRLFMPQVRRWQAIIITGRSWVMGHGSRASWVSSIMGHGSQNVTHCQLCTGL